MIDVSITTVEERSMELQLGLNSFGEVATSGGVPMTDAETLRLLVDEARLAEQVGLDVFSVGEHYRAGNNDSATPVLLAAMATATERIGLGTSVTVLSTNDPVRLYHEFSTLDAVSNGRAQIVLGRASATESFPLFGYDLADYERLFEEKTELFAQLLEGGPITWQGMTRPELHDQDVVPHLEHGTLPTWIGVGGSPQSVIRAARLGFALMLAIISGPPVRFAPFAELFRQALARYGRHPLPVGVHGPGHVAATDEQAREEFWPHWRELIRLVAVERGFAVPTEESFAYETGPHGALYVGSPETVAEKIATNLRALGANRFDLKYGAGGLPHETLMTNIELFGRHVIPRVRELLAQPPDSRG